MYPGLRFGVHPVWETLHRTSPFPVGNDGDAAPVTVAGQRDGRVR